MAPFIVSNPCAEQAHALLRAWQAGDLQGLQSQLDRTLEFCSSPAVRALDTERQELLESVAREMRQRVSAVRAAEPGDACVGLLRHLVLSAC